MNEVLQSPVTNYRSPITKKMKESIFIVIEGLDGSGKSTASRALAKVLNTLHPNQVKMTYEPHDPSTSGLYIRQVLTKKITNVPAETLRLAFALNRLDHGQRTINPWMEQGNIILCDRYYLSSLVYQSNENIDFDEIMDINKYARKPDLIFFFNVSNEVCYERMNKRNQPRELFETNLDSTRQKYLDAATYLEQKNHHIIHIDANGTVETIVQNMLQHIFTHFPQWSKKATTSNTSSTNNQLEVAFINYIKNLGYKVGDTIAGTDLTAYALQYELPGGIQQRGTALYINEPHRYDTILEFIQNPNISHISDFIFVFMAGNTESVIQHYQRERIKYAEQYRLSPSVRLVTEEDLN